MNTTSAATRSSPGWPDGAVSRAEPPSPTRRGAWIPSLVLLSLISLPTSCGGRGSRPPADHASVPDAPGPAAPETLPPRPFVSAGWMPDMSEVLRTRAASAPSGSMGDVRVQYRRVAPATVIVRDGHGMGTGVVVGPGGLVLTNNHVVAGARGRNFERRVTVEYGQLDSLGSMAPEGRQRRALVLATDPAHDLALVRVEDPVEGAPIIDLASDDPLPGEPVSCMGHGNIGLVWAIRSCEVVAAGRLEEAFSQIQLFCGSREERAQVRCRELRSYFHGEMEGLVVQSSCVIAPGDSGGPLVNDDGELVGLNVLSLSNEGRQSSSFHVHLRDIRSFLAETPTTAARDVPAPFFDGADARAADLDLDGRWETVLLVRPDRSTVRFYDLDEDSEEFSLGALTDVVATHRFDAELAIVSREDRRFAWYDRDADGRFELVLSQGPNGRVIAAHQIGPDGSVSAAPRRLAGPLLRPALVPAAGRARMRRLQGHIAAGGEEPSALPALLRRGRIADSDSDGLSDTLSADRGDVHALAFDADQDSLPGTTAGSVDRLVRERELDVELSVIRTGPTLFAYYDLDGDRTLEAGVRTAPRSPVVVDVIGHPPPGRLRADLLGTLAIHPGQFPAASALAEMVRGHVPAAWVAGPGDIGGLPDPTTHHHAPIIERDNTVAGWTNAIVSMSSHGISSKLVDVDGSSFRGPLRSRLDAGIEAAVNAGHFSADFAVVAMRGAIWTFYDTDLSGAWDTVLLRVRDGDERVPNAFRLGSDGSFAHAADLVDGPLVRPALFPQTHRARFHSLARELFGAEHVASP